VDVRPELATPATAMTMPKRLNPLMICPGWHKPIRTAAVSRPGNDKLTACASSDD
jgi:hypothetical protein